MGVKIEAGCGIQAILKARYGMKIGRRDRDILRFVGGIRDRTDIGLIITRNCKGVIGQTILPA